MADYKDTLNLPETAFPMRGNLPQREPEMLAFWEKADIYGKQRAAFADAPKFILHDGPPYANGAIHVGHALNKILKDIITKSRHLLGFNSPYIPAPMRRARSNCKKPISSALASSATGRIRI